MCHQAEGHRYTDKMTDAKLVDKLTPAADYVWRQMFPPLAHVARKAGGVLLQEWLDVLTGAANDVASCGADGAGDGDAGAARGGDSRRLLESDKKSSTNASKDDKCSGAPPSRPYALHSRSLHTSPVGPLASRRGGRGG